MADFISCSNPAYVTMYDMVSPLREGGTFLLNCQWSVEELNERLPASMKNGCQEGELLHHQRY